MLFPIAHIMDLVCTLINEYMTIISLIVLFLSVYTFNYLYCVAKKPQIIGKDVKFKTFLHKHCPVLQETYWPTFWCVEGRLMSILRVMLHKSVFRVPAVQYKSEILKPPDGGEICLEWMDDDHSNSQNSELEKKPIILFLYGVTGDSDEGYIIEFTKSARKIGYRSVVMNYRGRGKFAIKTAKSYAPPYTGDLELAMEHLKSNHPNTMMICVAVSMGATVLLNYLSKTRDSCGFKAALVFSPAWDMMEVHKSLETSINKPLFSKFILDDLKGQVVANAGLMKPHYDIEVILKCATVQEFEAKVLVKMFGYSNFEEYQTDCRLHHKLPNIKIPVLCLNATDDPISPECAFPIEEANQYSNIILAVTSRGGHVAFLEGWIPIRLNYMTRLFTQFTDAVLKFGEKELFSMDHDICRLTYRKS